MTTPRDDNLIEDFTCRGNGCCRGVHILDARMIPAIRMLTQLLEDYFEKPCLPVITSGFRCAIHNSRTPGASPTSRHMVGLAVDLYYPHVPNDIIRKMARTIDDFDPNRTITYKSHVHLELYPPFIPAQA